MHRHRRPRATVVALVSVLAVLAPQAGAQGRSPEELKALKAVMKEWSRALDVKCTHCHNPKDFQEWTANRTIGQTMSEVFVGTLKPPAATPGGECGACHTGSIKADEAKLAAIGKDRLKPLAASFKARAAEAADEAVRTALLNVAKYLEGL